MKKKSRVQGTSVRAERPDPENLWVAEGRKHKETGLPLAFEHKRWFDARELATRYLGVDRDAATLSRMPTNGKSLAAFVLVREVGPKKDMQQEIVNDA